MVRTHIVLILIFLPIFILLYPLTTEMSALGQQTKVDSLKIELKHASDTTRINILLEISNLLFGYGDPEAELFATEAMILSDSLKYEKGLVFSKWSLANITYKKENWPKAAQLFNDCITLYANLDSIKWLSSYHMAGYAYLQMDLYDKSLEYHLNGLKISESLGSPLYISASLRSTGYVYEFIDDWDTALDYYLKSLKTIENETPSVTLARALDRVAAAYFEKREYTQAITFRKRSLEVSKIIGSRSDEATALSNLGRMYRIQGLPEEAMPLLQQGLNIFEEINITRQIANCTSELSLVFLQLGNLDKAKSYGLRAYKLAENTDIVTKDLILQDLHDILEKSGDYETALKFRKIHMAVKDSLYKEQNNREIGKIEAKYEFDQLRAEEERQRLEKERIASEKRRRNFILLFGGIGLLLLIVIAGAVYTRTLGRKNRLISRQKEKLEELDHIKSNFFANISHEFRTPLTLIINPLKNLATRISDEESKSEVSLIERNAQKLLQLVNQLLDLAKLESGRMKKELQPGEIMNCFKFLAASFDSLAKSRSIRYTINIQPESLFTDFNQNHCETILNNILSNAFKFTPAGGEISLNVIHSHQSPLEGGLQGGVEIRLHDNGPGIPADKLPHIFDRFYQGDSSSIRQHEGTGIGLALVKELVEFYGGNIKIKSEPGSGTEVNINYPLQKIYSSHEVIQMREQLSKASKLSKGKVVELEEKEIADDEELLSIPEKNVVLIVEDSDDLRKHIREMLWKDFSVLEAGEGEKGLKLAIEKIPDLIISDIMMPKMDGNEMSRHIKTDPRTSHIPIILLTAKASKEDKIKGLHTGVDDYLTKPFDIDELRLKIGNLITIRTELQKKYSKKNFLQLSETEVTSIEEEFFKKAVKVVEENIENEDFSVEDLASEMFMSRVQFHRKIRALTNQPTTHFIRSIRLHRAAELLRKGAGNVTEVSYMVGFNSQSYFTRCFTEQFGQSPSEYQKTV